MDSIERAREELARLNEDPSLIEAIIRTMETFERQELDTLAQGFALGYLHRLLTCKPLTVLTNDPQEWEKVPGEGMWRSRRDPEAFSHNHGQTYWLMSDADMCAPEDPPFYRSAEAGNVVLPETYRDAAKLTAQTSRQLDEVQGNE